MIKLAGVCAFLGKRQVLDNINLEIPSEGITAIVGANGAGKSTLISAIARLTPTSAGKISIDGQQIDNINAKDFALKLAFMEQDNTVFARLSVRELIAFGRFPHHQGRLTEKDHGMVNTALNLFDLDYLRDRFVDTLSGGERQRARAAMCYCQETEYLLLDEPLNNLDIFYSKQLMHTLKKIAKEQQRSIIIVMHDINQAAHYADRIVALKQGSIVANGSIETVISPQTLEAIFGLPIEVEHVKGRPFSLYY